MCNRTCHHRAVGATLRVGTSGFAYDAWKGPFYPPTLRDLDLLPYYASRFTTVELNVTFRGTPTERAVANWRARTPEGFVFAVKAHARITHGARLAAPAEAQTEFRSRPTPSRTVPSPTSACGRRPTTTRAWRPGPIGSGGPSPPGRTCSPT